MQNKLPPLNALRAFEAGARHLSFTKAAEELHVTQAAVSHQVKALEEHLGYPLFKRMTRKLGLTEQGRALFPVVSEAFLRIADTADGLRSGPDSRTLTVRSEEHTSELQSLMRISYAVFCLKKKKIKQTK